MAGRANVWRAAAPALAVAGALAGMAPAAPAAEVPPAVRCPAPSGSAEIHTRMLVVAGTGCRPAMAAIEASMSGVVGRALRPGAHVAFTGAPGGRRWRCSVSTPDRRQWPGGAGVACRAAMAHMRFVLSARQRRRMRSGRRCAALPGAAGISVTLNRGCGFAREFIADYQLTGGGRVFVGLPATCSSAGPPRERRTSCTLLPADDNGIVVRWRARTGGG